jgi:hypothetical protein
VLGLLARFEVGLLVAVRPGQERALPRVLGACNDAGVRVGAWPMLEDADGRWVSGRNVPSFTAFVRGLVDAAQAEGCAPAEVAFDLEPPFDEVSRLLPNGSGIFGPGRGIAVDRGDSAGLGRAGLGRADEFMRAERELARLADELLARGIVSSAAAVPLMLVDSRWEQLLGTPVDGPGWGHVSFMLYTSILEGWSRGLLRRRDAVAILAEGCRAAGARYGARAGVSLGAVGVGAFGDEPTYRDPAELAEDVGVARAAGVDDLTLLDLGGVLRRLPAEPWLEAFVSAPAATTGARPTRRARAALSMIGAAGRALGAIQSWRRPGGLS